MYGRNRHICRVQGVPIKITDTNHAPCTHWHPPPLVGCVALSMDGSFSAANPLTKYYYLILQFSREYSFLKNAPIYFSLFVQCHNFDPNVQSYFRVIGVVLRH